MSFLQCGGAVHYYRLRAGVPRVPWLVFINGLGTDLRIWDGVLDALPRELTALVYDLRGQGLSELGEGRYDVARLSSDLEALLAGLGAGSVVPVGFSMGGLVAQQFALAHPMRARGLALVGTAARIASAEVWRERGRQVRDGGLPSIGAASMERWFSSSFRERQPHVVRGYRALLERGNGAAYLAGVELLGDTDLSSGAAQLSLPTLVVSASADVATPPERGRELAAWIQGAEFRLLAGAGHLMGVEQPEALARALAEFLETRLGGGDSLV